MRSRGAPYPACLGVPYVQTWRSSEMLLFCNPRPLFLAHTSQDNERVAVDDSMFKAVHEYKDRGAAVAADASNDSQKEKPQAAVDHNEVPIQQPCRLQNSLELDGQISIQSQD